MFKVEFKDGTIGSLTAGELKRQRRRVRCFLVEEPLIAEFDGAGKPAPRAIPVETPHALLAVIADHFRGRIEGAGGAVTPGGSQGRQRGRCADRDPAVSVISTTKNRPPFAPFFPGHTPPTCRRN